MFTRRQVVAGIGAVLASTVASSSLHLAGAVPPIDVTNVSLGASGNRNYPDAVFRAQPGDELTGVMNKSFAAAPGTPTTVLLSNDLVIAAGGNGSVEAISASDASPVWSTDSVAYPLAVRDDVALIRRAQDHATAVAVVGTADGLEKWSTVESLPGPGILVDNYAVYVTTPGSESHLTCRSVQDGESIWTTPVTGATSLLSAEGAVIAHNSQRNNDLEAFNIATGERIWQRDGSILDCKPFIAVDHLWVIRVHEAMMLDLGTGETVASINLPVPLHFSEGLAMVQDILISNNGRRVVAQELRFPELKWTTPLLYGGVGFDVTIAGNHVLVSELGAWGDKGSLIVRGYVLDTGERAFQVSPTSVTYESQSGPAIAVGEGSIYLAADRGVRVFPKGTDAFVVDQSPVADQQWVDDVNGYLYAWDESWQVLGADEVSPNGWNFQHTESGAIVSQFVGRSMLEGADFASFPPRYVPEQLRSYASISSIDVPELPFDLPSDARVAAARIEMDMPEPHNELTCVRVRLPLANGKMLGFEFVAPEIGFEQAVDAFEVFFKSLQR